MSLILWLDDPRATDARLAGHKAARLAELLRQGLRIPAGFVLTTEAFEAGMTPAVEAALSGAFRRLTGDPAARSAPLAVRSSATAEDLATASFAGVQSSVLGVEGFDALRSAVCQVWDSLCAPAAQAYREKLGLAPGLMAVLVQHLVRARVSGVAFARDPISGERALVVEAGRGAGDEVLSGRVEPQRWRISSDGAVAAPGHALLAAADLAALRSLVARVEQALGEPPDVEWALEGDGLWLLQARPITTARPGDERNAAAWFTTLIPGDRHLWTAGFLDERFTQPVSPLGWSLVAGPFERRALREPLALLGAPLDDAPLIKLWRGHPYTRAAVWQRIYRLFPDWLLPDDAVRFFPDSQVALRRAPRRPVLGAALFWNAIRTLLQQGGAASPLHNPRAWYRFERELEEALQRWRRRLLDLPVRSSPLVPARALLGDAARMTDRLLALHRWSLLYAELLYTLLRRGLIARCGPERGSALLASLVGDVGTVTAQLNRAMAELAAPLLRDPKLQAALRSAGKPGDLPPGSFSQMVAEFLQRYGHRFFSLDLFDPPWCEDFPAFARLLLAIAEGGPARERPLRVGERVPFWARPLLRLARPYLRLREAQRFRWQQVLAVQRRAVLCLGEWWAACGRLRQPEHVFGLTWVELMDGEPDAGCAAARMERLEQLRAEARLAPGWHYPDFLEGDTPLLHDAPSEAARLVGRPVSPGVIRGPARLVADARDFSRLRAGDILVTASPDPAWTPIFGTVAGMIAERGGQLSHGAVVAREYGLPAVSGMPGALTLLRDGEMLLLDGTHGTVLRLEVAAHEATT